MNKNSLIIFLICLAILSIVFNKQISNIFVKQPQRTAPLTFGNKLKTAEPAAEPSVNNEVIRIRVNPPTEFSYKTKEEIYNIRKEYVKTSIFSQNDYEPSDEVFGQIEDNKPWIANTVCKDPYNRSFRTDGPSEEARFINNPALLVAIEYPFSYSNYGAEFDCSGDAANLVPGSILYDRSAKLISVLYKKLPHSTDNGFSFYTFNGLNARDLGYSYAYVDMSKSTYPIEFSGSSNISTGVIQFRNFIHLGNSCGVQGGCNNGSPRQTYLEFKQGDTDYTSQDGKIYIKLWRKKPDLPAQDADLTEIIIIKEY